MTKILLPVDGSPRALRAARKLVEIAAAWKERPEITPLFVQLPVPVMRGMKSRLSKTSLGRYYQESSHLALYQTLGLLTKAGYPAMPVTLLGPIAESIVDHAKKNKFDLICLGTRGMSATANLLMGSVTTRVLNLSDIPVLTIR